MNIRIRGINDYLCFEIKNDLEFNRIYDELKSILLMLPESKNGYYPKALFHFEMKKMSKKQMTAIIDLIYDTKKVLFGGILYDLVHREMVLLERDIYNGQVVDIQDQDVLLIGHIHVGGTLRCYRNVYVIGLVEGQIEALGVHSTISLSSSKEASLLIFNARKQNVTIFTLTTFYYGNEEIHNIVSHFEVNKY